jgi:hypothetical protein
MHRACIILLAVWGVALAGCQHTPTATTQLTPEKCVEVGTVTPHGVWSTKKALARAGIPAYTDGSQYPSPYRILVPPEFRDRAVALLREIEKRPSSFGYGITHD